MSLTPTNIIQVCAVQFDGVGIVTKEGKNLVFLTNQILNFIPTNLSHIGLNDKLFLNSNAVSIIMMDLQEVEIVGIDWIGLAQD
jgi:hypothetical protein